MCCITDISIFKVGWAHPPTLTPSYHHPGLVSWSQLTTSAQSRLGWGSWVVLVVPDSCRDSAISHAAAQWLLKVSVAQSTVNIVLKWWQSGCKLPVHALPVRAPADDIHKALSVTEWACAQVTLPHWILLTEFYKCEESYIYKLVADKFL